MSTTVKEISRRICRIRKSKEYSQSCISTQLGINQQAYNKIENGATKIGIIRLLKIAAILELELNQLLFENTQPLKPSKEEISEGLELI